MAKPFAKQFYNSKAWKECRQAFISYRVSIDGGACEHCKKELGYIVDHKEELTPDNINDPMITLNQQNFQYLCLSCHTNKTFGFEGVTREGLYFNDNGELVQA